MVWLLLMIGLLLLLAAAWVVARYLQVAASMYAERRQIKHPSRIQNLGIPKRTLLSLTHNFTQGEDSIFWADRQHWIAYWPAGIMLILLSVFFTVVTIGLAVHPLSYTVHFHSGDQARQVHLKAIWLLWLPLVVALLCGLSAWLLWLRWRAVFRLITNRGLLLEFQPWPWAWWLWNDEQHDPQPYRSIISAEPKGTFWGRLLGYGQVEVKTYRMENEDEPLHSLRFVGGYKEFARVLNEQRELAATDGPADAVPR